METGKPTDEQQPLTASVKEEEADAHESAPAPKPTVASEALRYKNADLIYPELERTE